MSEAPLIEVQDGGVTTPKGFFAGATAAGIRDGAAPGRLDLALLRSEELCSAAGVYTQSTFRGPPIIVTERNLVGGRAQAVIANSGISNSLSGEEGMRNAEEMARIAAAKLDVAPEDVVVASTGVTGWRLPVERMRDALLHILLTEDGGDAFAHAIMTTDTVAKQHAVHFEHGGHVYAVGGCAKGSGMIHPDMATMLGFMTTDAPVTPDTVASILRDAVDVSFNMITVDGDTSPNDMVVLLANGAAGGDVVDTGHPALPLLRAAVEHVSMSLARKLARDGEGASKLIEIRVDGAADPREARRAAKAVAGSSLVKAAVYGNDPNWGRVLVAVGYSGSRVDEARVAVSVQDVDVCRDGAPVPFDEAGLRAALGHPEVRIRVELGIGESSATAWGCDLTPEYVRINAEYTT
jgi:glutamate N-acetyltransferase/amino-acid N-acetyltransferase